MSHKTTAAEHFDDIEDNKKAAAVSYPRRKFAAAAPIPSKMLHCALFRVADKRVPRAEQVRKTFPLSSGGYLEYKGSELRQDEGNVFAALAHLTAGFGPAKGALFKPADLVKQLGWSKTDHSTTRLDECLMRLRDASLAFFTSNGEKAWLTGLVLEIEYKVEGKPDYWHVSLSDKLRSEAFEHFSQTTHLNTNILATLSGGLTSWLYAFIASQACDTAFLLDDLHTLSGSGTKDAKEWGRQVRAALDTLEKRKVILGYASTRGWVKVQKNPRQPSE